MRAKLARILSSAALGLVASTGAYANVGSDLNTFLQGLGFQSNVTAPQAFKGQAAGYYTGGSIFLRNQVRNYQLASIELPSFSAGCSGIDAYFGSFSAITAEQLIQMMENILSAGGAYAFDLALTSFPKIKSAKDKIENFVHQVNRQSINSCNMAEDLVGGMWPKIKSASQQVCKDIGTHHGYFSDWAQARQGCGTGGKFKETVEKADEYESQVIINKNLVWDALSKNGMTNDDPELAEMMMSLSGTYIVYSNDEKSGINDLPSVVTSRALVKALLRGGDAEIYRCDEKEKCLNPTKSTVTITEQQGLVSQVAAMIDELNTKMVSDESELSNKTRAFLEMTPLPIMKKISTDLSLGKAVNPAAYSEIIAIDLLNQYLSQGIRLVQQAVHASDTALSPQMKDRAYKAQTMVAEKTADSYRKLANTKLFTDSTKADERRLVSRLSNLAAVGQNSK